MGNLENVWITNSMNSPDCTMKLANLLTQKQPHAQQYIHMIAITGIPMSLNF